MADLSDKYALLVDRLYRNTIVDKIIWELDRGGVPLTKISDKTIRVSKSLNSDGQPLVVVTVYGESGSAIESFNDEFLTSISPPDSDFMTYWAKMEALHQLAIRRATGADKALDELLRDLDDKNLA